ncbi:hypothetical protein BGX27_011361 [Mortierella sp. AM989]|nr:hypothetical protein BGX27_011361 [Mortierella sp. AM989]
MTAIHLPTTLRNIPWKMWLLVVLLVFLGHSTAAYGPIILPPSSIDPDQIQPDVIVPPSSSTLTPEPSQSDPILAPSPTLSSTPLPLTPLIPPQRTTSPLSTPLHSSSPYHSSSTIQVAKPTPSKHAPYNRAAANLKLVHVPLKVSCDILRQFYNSTGGTNWSNQDGWQYVDSVTIPQFTPRTSGGALSGGNSSDLARMVSKRDYHKRKHSVDRDDDSFIDPPLTATHLSLRSATEGSSSLLSPLVNGPAGSAASEDKTSPIDDAVSVDNLDPDNCCGWYGVVCIGPDGVIPAPWPPYDDDLISSTSSTRSSVTARDLRSQERHHALWIEKRGTSGSYYNYHDRNQHHHSKDDGDGSSDGDSRGTGVSDNQHQLDGGNNEGGRLSDDPDSGKDQESGSNNLPISSPSMDNTNSGSGRGGRVKNPDDWYIIELHLGFNSLKGPVPEQLSGLVNLMILDISNNELTGQIPDSYSNLTRLKRFDISSNQITGAFPVAVTKMVNIQELVLKNNYLTGSLPAEVLKLRQLTELSIANNEFDGMLPSGLFGSLTKLRVININQNGFSGEIGADIGALVGLLKFSARANEFRGRIPKELGNCRQLQSLNLGDNHFIGEIPESIYGLQNLRVLDIPANKLTGPISEKIGNMVSLTRLILSHNEFYGPLPVEIQNLTRMEYMVINYNKFDGLFPIALAPPLITVCLVQPNEFTSCPPNSSLETSTTLAYQCNLDCRDHVIHPEIYDAISRARPQYAMWGNFFELNMGMGMGMVIFVTALIQIL